MAVTFLNDVSLGSDIELQLAGSSGGKLFANSKFYIQGDAIVFRSYDGGETYATFTDNSDVSLRHNNVIKFETESFGTSTKGYLQIDNDPDTANDVKTAINVGTSDQSSSSAFAVSVANDAEEVYISSNLFYNGSGGQLKPLTSSGSADIYMYIGDSTSTTTGTIVLGGHYAISGGAPSSLVSHMVIKGNGNVGIGDTNPQVKLQLPDNAKIGLGNAGSTPDLQIYHDGSDSYVQDTGTGDLKLLGTNLRLKNAADSSTFLEALSGSTVSIYHNGSKKFNTTSTGISITGGFTTSGSSSCAGLNMTSDIAMAGNTISLSSNSIIENDGNGGLVLNDSPTGSEGNGIIIKRHTTTTTAGYLYYLSHLAATWSTVIANNTGATRMLAIALGTNSGTDGMLLQGIFRKAMHGFSAGSPLYVGSTTAGLLSSSPPTGDEEYARIVGYAIDSNTIYFNPSGTWVEVSA